MLDKIDICHTCLRTDLNLKVIDPMSRLSDFYEELTDISYYSLSSNSPKLCAVCEHLLRKLHNFKEKCVLSIKILQQWNKTKDVKKPLYQLYTLLPESALGIWMPKNTKTFYFEEEPKPQSNNSTPSTELASKMQMLASGPNKNTQLLVQNLNTLKPGAVLSINTLQPPSTKPVSKMPMLAPAPNKNAPLLVPNLNMLKPGAVSNINALQPPSTEPVSKMPMLVPAPNKNAPLLVPNLNMLKPGAVSNINALQPASTEPVSKMPMLAPAPNKNTPLLVPNINTLKPGVVLNINALQPSATTSVLVPISLETNVNVPLLLRTSVNVLSLPGTTVNVPSQVVTSVNIPRPAVTNINVPRPTVTNVNVPRPTVTNVNVPRPTVTNINVPRPTVTNVNVPRPTVASVNESRPTVASVNESRPLGTSVSLLQQLPESENVQRSQQENIFTLEKFIFIDNSKHLDNSRNQGLFENPIPIEEIKLETNGEDDSQVLNLEDDLKTENETDLIFEIEPENVDNCDDIELLEKIYIQGQNKDDTEIVQKLDDAILISDDDMTDNILDFTFIDNVEGVESDSSINSEDLREIDKALDDSSIEVDDNDDKVREIKTRRQQKTKKKSLTELANVTLSDDDFITNSETEIQDEEFHVTDDDDECKTNNIIANMENIKTELDSINDNYENILLQSGNTAQKNNERKNYKHKKRKMNIEKMFTIINKDMDAVQNNCEDIISRMEDPLFIQERLKALKEDLRAKFESCGELKTAKGVVIDKEHVLTCLDGRAFGLLMDLLCKAVNHKKILSPKAVKILALIQQKYNKSKYESVFDIEYMNTPEAMKEEIQKRQTYPWYIKAKYKCELCYTAFKYEKHLENHKKTHEESAGDLVCPICGVRRKVKRHLRIHLPIHETVYRCKLCPLVTYYERSMKNHYNQHKGVEYRCEPCNRIFPSASAYYTHRAYAHRRAHVCTTCGRTFETEETRDKHQRGHRVQPSSDGSTSVMCDTCGLAFPSQQVYERHVRFSHEVTPWGDRDKCKGKIINKNKQNRRKKFKCPVCEAAGGSYAWLMLHGRLEHNEDMEELYAHKRTYLCDVCGKGFTTKGYLRYHLNKHTGNRPFACESCPKRFTTGNYLQNHRLYHLPPAQLCTHCGKKFHTKSNLYSHIQSHVGNRRYKCNICGKGFDYGTVLRDHKRGVHYNVRRVRKRGGTKTAGREVTEARVVRASTRAARSKRRKMKEVESSGDESSDSD